MPSNSITLRDHLRRPDDQGWKSAEFGKLADVLLSGLHDVDEPALAALLCFFAHAPAGTTVRHVLLEGINGTAKTMLAKQLNRALIGPALRGLYELCPQELTELKRSQGSPELYPSDLVGADSLATDEAGSQVLRFAPGPLLGNHIMFYADELNRSHPRTQSVLLEAMAEAQITINTQDPGRRRLHEMPDFFLVASQNPEKHIGTFPLPEAQLDRFMIRAFMPYSKSLETIVLRGKADGNPTQRGSSRRRSHSRLVRQLRASQTSLQARCRTRCNEIDSAIQASKKRIRQYRANLNRLKVQRAQAAQLALNEQRMENRRLAALTRAQPVLKQLAQSLRFAAELWKELNASHGANRQLAAIVEEWLLEARRAELRTLRDEVRRVDVGVVAKRIADLVYATWSRSAAADTIEGLDGVVSENSRIQATVKELAHGASVRGAEALRDFARALAWARGVCCVSKEDVDIAAPHVLNHRVQLVRERPQGWYCRDKIAQLVR